VSAAAMENYARLDGLKLHLHFKVVSIIMVKINIIGTKIFGIFFRFLLFALSIIVIENYPYFTLFVMMQS
jgi:hypothetical protein